jgi:hypothetical protein
MLFYDKKNVVKLNDNIVWNIVVGNFLETLQKKFKSIASMQMVC